MRCPICNRENPEDGRFCIFCGSPLAIRADTGQGGGPQEQVQALQSRLDFLQRTLIQLTDRVAALERSQGIVPAQPPPPLQPLTPSPAMPVAEPALAPGGEGEDIFDRIGRLDWEQVLGGNWLARIGVVALIIGMGFFLKLAFDNQWIGPTGRVVLGLVGGVALLGAGEYWQRRYPALAQALTGGGIAILYLSIFAALVFYELIAFNWAVVFLLLVSVTAAGLALRYGSMALAVIGMIGAFAAPFLLGGFNRAAAGPIGADRSAQLLVYVMAVDMGVLALATFRNWRWLTLLGLIASLVSFGIWEGEFGDRVSLLTSVGGLTVMFLIFAGATTLFHIVWRRAPTPADQALMVLNAAFYYGISYGLLFEDFRLWLGGFTLVLALFYALLAYAALLRSGSHVYVSFLALGIALVFLTVAVPVQLGDRAWTTVAWAAEGVVLVWLSFTVRMPRLRLFALAVFAITVWRLLFFDTDVPTRGFRPILNERFLAYAVAIGAAYLSAYLLWRRRADLRGWETYLAPSFAIGANLFTIGILSADLFQYLDRRIDDAYLEGRPRAVSGLEDVRNLSLTLLWTAYASLLLVIGIVARSRTTRLGGLALLAIAVAKLFVLDVFSLERGYRVAAFISLGIVLVVGGYLYQRYSKAIRGFLIEQP
ncbi:MAG: DUF2339 domain-containing protein [Chloroflexi bacterium]|nr:DUF2339 domain-containing protein [Chloroflexota bacterium]